QDPVLIALDQTFERLQIAHALVAQQCAACPIREFGNDWHAQKQIKPVLPVEPTKKIGLRLIAPDLRDHISVEDDHSKPGTGRSMSVRISSIVRIISACSSSVSIASCCSKQPRSSS